MKQGKYDIIIMPIIVDGVTIGHFVRKRTARQAWEDKIKVAKLRRLFNEQRDNSRESFITPIIGE